MNADELQAELNKLWSRVNNDAVPDIKYPELPGGVDTGSPVRDASVEAMQLLRRQREAETAELRHLIALKENALRDMTDRLKSVQAELLRARQQQTQKDRQVLAEMLGVQGKLQGAQGLLKEQEDRFLKEERVLRDIAEKTRQQLAAETARWRELEHQWNQREQQYLLDVKEAQTLLKRAEDAAAKSEDRARRTSDELKNAKSAVEATLAELLAERNAREHSDQERDRALKKVAEVEEHFQELQKIWQEERKQWQELWDRERSGWDARQQELTTWEQKFRQEREAWHADLKAKEGAELKFAEQMAQNLRQSSEATHQLSGAITAMRQAASGAPEGRGLRRTIAAVLASALLAGVGLPAWQYVTRLRLVPLAGESVAAESPTGLAFDGTQLWVTEYSGRFLKLDPGHPSQQLSSWQVAASGPYHPGALTASADTLWTVDTAQARILRHATADPSVPRDSWSAPGTAPVAVAHDGTRLWTFDVVNRTLYRHEGDGPNAPTQGYPLDLDVVPTSMQWAGSELWMHDSKGHRLLRIKLLERSAAVTGQVKVSDAVISAVVRTSARGRLVWALLRDGRGGASIQRLELQGR
ncbi:MAG: hypothetical protein HY553_00650 [Elusimicrobia bacterium]|nr:hypothetical protein [Elusimicrobiota bacterium]